MLKNAHTAGSCRLPEGSSGKEWNAALCAIRNLTDRVFFSIHSLELLWNPKLLMKIIKIIKVWYTPFCVLHRGSKNSVMESIWDLYVIYRNHGIYWYSLRSMGFIQDLWNLWKLFVNHGFIWDWLDECTLVSPSWLRVGGGGIISEFSDFRSFTGGPKEGSWYHHITKNFGNIKIS